MVNSSERVLNYSISDYLDCFFKKRKNPKLVMFITTKQSAYMIGNKDHLEKMVLLSQQLFPDMNYEYGNLYEGGIEVCSVVDYLEIYLPDTINYTQYLCLVELVDDIEKYEQENGVKIKHIYEKEKLLEEALSKIVADKKDVGERIIEGPITLDTEILNSKPHNMKNIELNEEELSFEDDKRSMR